MGSLFSSSEYVLYRFEYPEKLFHLLRSHLSPSLIQRPLQVMDLGCGTGLVTESFLKTYEAPLEVHLIDPDQEMLQEAQKQFSANSKIKSTLVASAEKIPFPDQSFDLVLIGSAWHWMNQDFATNEIERVLKPGGVVFIFEYQFPKSIELGALNDWIRQKFNLEWKPAKQVPRGSLKELTECWRKHPHFSQIDFKEVVHDRFHSSTELAGVIISQSRYQHFENSLSSKERLPARLQLARDLSTLMDGKSALFRYLYEGFLMKKRV